MCQDTMVQIFHDKNYLEIMQKPPFNIEENILRDVLYRTKRFLKTRNYWKVIYIRLFIITVVSIRKIITMVNSIEGIILVQGHLSIKI